MLLDNKETTTQKASPTLLESAGLKWLVINAVVGGESPQTLSRREGELDRADFVFRDL